MTRPIGMTMTAAIPSRAAWNATAEPWLPALAAATPSLADASSCQQEIRRPALL